MTRPKPKSCGDLLRSGLQTAILLAGSALYGKGLKFAARIAAAASAKLLAPYPFTRMERGAGVAVVERIPYVLEQAVEQLKNSASLFWWERRLLLPYFASPGKNSVLTSPDCEIHALARPGEDFVGALEH